MKRNYLFLCYIVLISLLSGCSIDSWSMDYDVKVQLSDQFNEYLKNTDFDPEVHGTDFNYEMYDTLVFLLSDENYDEYVRYVSGKESPFDSYIKYSFRMSKIEDDNVFDGKVELNLQIYFNLEKEIDSIAFSIDYGDSFERLFISHHDIMLSALNEKEGWICIDEICYIEETIGAYTTIYNSENRLFEIIVIDEVDTIIGSVYYYRNSSRVSYIDNSNLEASCFVSDLSKCGFSEEQMGFIENSILIIKEFSLD